MLEVILFLILYYNIIEALKNNFTFNSLYKYILFVILNIFGILFYIFLCGVIFNLS